MAYKVLDLYRDLPGTNCGECGRGSCFAFASAVGLTGVSLAECPQLSDERRGPMEARLAESRGRGEGRRPERSEQALGFLMGQLVGADLGALARACGGAYSPGPPEGIELDFLSVPHRITRDDVATRGAAPPTVWVKIFLLIYATRASGEPAAEEWVAYRELPNAASKARSFEEVVSRLAADFEGRGEALAEAVRRLGGVPEAFTSAGRAWRLRALPRVDLLFLFWERDEEFPARASLLVDRSVLAYLDQEALLFLAEAVAARLKGVSLEGIVP